MFHKHKWEYERHNSLVIRSCNCGETQEGIIDENPQLTSTSLTKETDLDKIIWETI